MKPISILFILLCSIQCLFGQQLSREDSLLIDHFKKDPHTEIKVAAYYDTIGDVIKPVLWSFNDSLCLGDLILEKAAEYNDEEEKITLRRISTYRNYHLIREEYYFHNSPQLQRITEYTANGYRTGMYKEYLNNGKLDHTIDHERQIWTVYNTQAHPYYKKQKAIQTKADSIIARWYGQDFFNNNVMFDPAASKLGEKDGGWSYWTAPFKQQPNDYILEYHIKIDGQKFPARIGFTFNKAGEPVKEDTYGLEQLPEHTHAHFQLTFKQALKEAVRQGFPESDTIKADGVLTWESPAETGKTSGAFVYYITVPQEEMKAIPGDHRGWYIYTLYVFNPWTGEFIEKKEMKAGDDWDHVKDFVRFQPLTR
ncbi:hypothetical protein [Chitinophaga pinensis]|uniref:Uncharacterized protein n=1 Tax=Chitinophaga pinensis (strain ATCC 43595 / DSM 2588 / LMG 13176 / NBRC 15968 / NCIMB 11800 / UQM 2034) TaxID=485918 RepID=A0A979GZS1_CHIPD|nr:hypothetical protein [Chitinophaga pinensis]ACU62780.1 hypothetical protein Cpin_5349 [Chitinophaga pinensis DSM 2588]